MHIPEHLNSTGTLVTARRHFFQILIIAAQCVVQRQKRELDKSSDRSAVVLLNASEDHSSCVTPALYIITFLHQQSADKSAYLQSAKRSGKKSLQSITDKVKRQNVSADKTTCSLRTAYRSDEGHDVIQYFLPVKYQCGDIYSNSTCTYTKDPDILNFCGAQ